MPTSRDRAPRRRPGRPQGAVAGRHDDRLDEILRTAAVLFAEHGYEATSLDRVAAALGMHKATLYHYVDGKESILYQCQARSFPNLDEVERRMADTARPVRERLREFVLQLAQAQHSEFGRCLTMVGSKPLAQAAGGRIRRIQRQLDLIVRRLLEEGVASGELRIADIGLAVALIFGALNWVPRWYRADGRLSVAQIAEGFLDLIEGGIAAPAAAPIAGPIAAPTVAPQPGPRRTGRTSRPRTTP